MSLKQQNFCFEFLSVINYLNLNEGNESFIYATLQMNQHKKLSLEQQQKNSSLLVKNLEEKEKINLTLQVQENNKNKSEICPLSQKSSKQNALSIIKSQIDFKNQQKQASNNSDQEFNKFSQIIFDTISELSNTQQIIIQEQQQQQIQQIKSFFSTIQINYDKLDYKCYNQIINLGINFDDYIQSKNEFLKMHIHLFKCMIDANKLQQEQQLSNCLLNDSVKQENELNNAFLAATLVKIYQQRVLKLTKQPMKLLFIDITFIESDNYPLYKNFHNSNDCIYIKLMPIKNIENLRNYNYGLNYHIINFHWPENGQLSWTEWSLILKFQIKKLFKYFNYNFCVLSTCCDIENDQAFRLESDCLRKFVQKIRKIAKDKLFIHSILRQVETAAPKIDQKAPTSKEIVQQETVQKYKQHLNPLYLGNFDNSHDKQHKLGQKFSQNFYHFIYKQIKLLQKGDVSTIKQYAQILGNYYYSRSILPINQTLYEPEIALFQDKDKEKFVKLKYQNIYIDFQKKSIIKVSYEKKKIVVFQIDLLSEKEILYIGDFPDFNLDEIQCQKVDLSEFIYESQSAPNDQKIKDENNISMTIKDNSVIIYIPCLERIIFVDIHNLNVQAIQKNPVENQQQQQKQQQQEQQKQQQQQQLSQLLKQRRGVILINQSFKKDYDIIAFGGEIINSPLQCNIIQLIQFVREGEVIKSFKQSIIAKQSLMKTNQTFIPWPSNIILQSKEVPFKLLLLPGSYENKLDKYNQYINYEFQKIATVFSYLTTGEFCKFNHLKIEYKEVLIKFNDDVQYQNCEKLGPIPLSELSSNQNNYKLSESGWTIFYTLASAINLQKYFKDALDRTYVESSILIVDLKIQKDILEVSQKLQIRTDRKQKMYEFSD